MTKVRPLLFAIAVVSFVTLTAAQQLDDSQAISHVSTSQKVVALTVDDGPHHKVTPQILNVLREKQVKVTFFVLGINVNQFPSLLAQEVADGHEIGIHTYSHPSLTQVSRRRIAEEFDKAEKAILPLAPKPVLFRPPGGFYDSQVIDAAHQRGYSVILWSIDPEDWSCPPAERIVDKVAQEVRPGSIVLLHDGQYPLPTPQALGQIIDRLRERGYQFVTVSELLAQNEVRHTFTLPGRDTGFGIRGFLQRVGKLTSL